MILQRYTFGSKSQPLNEAVKKGIVAYDIAKIYIWKQFTTHTLPKRKRNKLLMILQR